MRAKKYGGGKFFRNSVVRRHLFFNSQKSYGLSEVLEFSGTLGGCVGKYWEVHEIQPSENLMKLERKLILRTPVYSLAWDLVKDPLHDERKRK